MSTLHERCDNCSGIDPESCINARPTTSTLHEQARAEAEKRYPSEYSPGGDRARFVEGFLAGHEAATRTREVTTVAELDALPEASVVLDQHQDPWQKSEGGWDSPNPYLPLPWSNERLASTGPLTVLHEPEEGR